MILAAAEWFYGIVALAAGFIAIHVGLWASLNQSLREAVFSRVVVFVDGEMLIEQAWMLLW
jgi:hypothetical protein